MIGKPKYSYTDKVTFKAGDKIREGAIEIIDKYGTFLNKDDVYYDIFSSSDNTLYKHIPEYHIKSKES